jgi:hypothetical protein
MKKLVSIYVLHNLLGDFYGLTDDQVKWLMTMDHHDLDVLRDIIRRWIVPSFLTYDDLSQACVKTCLEYFLAKNGSALERVLPSSQVPVEPPSSREFFELVWHELFHAAFDKNSIDTDNYEEVDGTGLSNSLYRKGFTRTVE